MDFNVKNDYEYVGNYKVLQEALNKVGIKKVGDHGWLAGGAAVTAQLLWHCQAPWLAAFSSCSSRSCAVH